MGVHMFDNIGRDLDPEANRRRATSLFLTTAGCCAALGMLVGIATYTAVQALEPPEVDDGPIVLLDLPEEEPTALPAAPPPPPPAAGVEVEDPEPVVPDELVDEIQELQDEVEERVVAAEQPQGTADGHDNGHPDGVAGGTPGGDPDGELCGVPGAPACGPSVRVFHHTELQVRRRVEPVYPDAARALAVSDQRCLVTVFLDESGVPYDAKVDRCPKPFHQASREALRKWRWYPPKDGKARIRAQTTIAITYRLD
jgi:hypothetical protein